MLTFETRCRDLQMLKISGLNGFQGLRKVVHSHWRAIDFYLEHGQPVPEYSARFARKEKAKFDHLTAGARQQPDGEGCAQLVVEDVLADSVAADDGRAAAGMVLHRVGRTRATRLSVRDVQRRLLAATPDRRVTLSLLPAAAATCEAADDAIDAPDADGDGDGAAGSDARKRKRKKRRRKRSPASTN